jgi:hypothetical protein
MEWIGGVRKEIIRAKDTSTKMINQKAGAGAINL